MGQKLIEIYDTNGDGVLQPSEFAPKADLRVRLESLFADRAQVCLSFSSFSSFLNLLFFVGEAGEPFRRPGSGVLVVVVVVVVRDGLVLPCM